MLELATNTLLKLSVFRAFTYSFLNTIEKYLFSYLNININNYLLMRNILMAVIFIVIYFKFNGYLLDSEFENITTTLSNKLAIVLIIVAVCLNLLFNHLSNYGFKKYDISIFTIIFTVLYLIFNTFSGIIFFKEVINTKQLLGLMLGICSIFLLNY